MPSSRLIWIATWWALLATPATATQTPSGDRLLNRMVGRWRMSGQVRGRPAVYDLDSSLVVMFSYPDGPFRDTITFDIGTGGWRLLMETGRPGGGWTTFADYQVHRR